MFVVEVGSVLTTILFLRDLGESSGAENVFAGLVDRVPVVHGAVRQLRRGDGRGRGKAQAATLRQTRSETVAQVRRADGGSRRCPRRTADRRPLRRPAGEVIPGDGDVVEGIATVDESAITGESAPVIRESGGDRSAVTGGTRVLSDEIVVRITARPGETFLDRMIALVEGADRQKTPNEIALSILLAGLTLIFLLATSRCSRSPSTAAPSSRSSCSSPCSCASSRRRSAACCRRSASPAWTAWCSATCWRCPVEPSKPPAT